MHPQDLDSPFVVFRDPAAHSPSLRLVGAACRTIALVSAGGGGGGVGVVGGVVGGEVAATT